MARKEDQFQNACEVLVVPPIFFPSTATRDISNLVSCFFFSHHTLRIIILTRLHWHMHRGLWRRTQHKVVQYSHWLKHMYR
jgi:hypothetical protein